MRRFFTLSTDWPTRLFVWPKPRLSRLFLVEKRAVALGLFNLGMVLLFMISLSPWFLWPVYRYAAVVGSLPVMAGMALSLRLEEPVFSRKDFLWPTAAIALLYMTMAVSSGRNINALFMAVFTTTAYFGLFKVGRPHLQKLSDTLTTIMALILCVSIPTFVLHLLGFPFPHFTTHFAKVYAFENYLFFLIDYRFNWELLPRFHSVFLEPSHLGMACVTLLYSQAGRWNTWRCRVLFLALAMSFSVAAYGLALVMFFSVSWMKGRAVLGKIILLGGTVLTLGAGSVFYNRGENLINQLIVKRVTMNDEGEMGDSKRTSDLFTREFDKAIETGDILLGRGQDEMARFGFGNAGYRVYLYCFGFVSLIALLFLFITILHTSPNRRACVAMVLVHLLSFWAHGVPHRHYIFIPLYILLFSPVMPARPQLTAPCKPATA